MSDPARAASFGRTAELYELGRTGYPADLLQRVFAGIGIVEPRILDLAAGTGKLTRQLVDFGSVVAVEPLLEMREQFHRVLPGLECLEGNAESIPLPDSSIDVVAVGQAYHWFDQERANPEIWRVLRDGGWLVALWNDEAEEVPWIAELAEIMSRNDSFRHLARFDWRDYFVNEPWFTAPELLEGSMVVQQTKAQLLASMESHSYLSIKPIEERAPILAEVAALIAPLPDPIDVPFETVAFLCRKQPAGAS